MTMERFHYETSTWTVDPYPNSLDQQPYDLDGFGIYDRKLSGFSTDNWIAFCVDRCAAEKIVAALNAVDDTPDGKVSTFRYVPHGKVQEYLRKGWEITNALEGTRHGHFSILMKAPA